MSRWIATITYRIDAGFAHMRHDLEEIEDLHDIVEKGPDWDTIDGIVIHRAGGSRALTVEKAAQL